MNIFSVSKKFKAFTIDILYPIVNFTLVMTGLIVHIIRDGIHRGFFFCKLVIKDNTQNSPDSILKQPVN